MPTTADFLSLLFGHIPPGCIEVRVIEDRKNGSVIDRRWYDSVQDLVADLGQLNRLSESNAAGVFFGVLPRKGHGLGGSEATLQGYVSWGDLDFRDYPEGEVGARRILNAFALPPSITAFTGHGLHPYWLMREPTDPSVLSKLSKRLGVTLHGDHVGDAARIMRLPGTWNRKDPNAPILVAIEHLDSSRRYNPSDLEEYLLPLEEEARHDTPPGESVRIGEKLSPRVIHVLDQNPTIQGLFEGRGKTAIDEKGRRLDTSSSGYDFSVILALARKRVTDESELATVLWFRSDDAARSKGIGYITRTVRRALDQVGAESRKAWEDETTESAFTVQHVKVYASNPRKYELLIDGALLELCSSDLLSPARFRLRFLDALGRLPGLPRGAKYQALVSQWLEKAEIVEQPPEASTSEFLREEIQRVIGELRTGERADDLDRGLAVIHNGTPCFKTSAIFRRLRDTYREVQSGEICLHLRALGHEWGTPRIDGKAVRVWTKAESPETSAPEGPAA